MTAREAVRSCGPQATEPQPTGGEGTKQSGTHVTEHSTGGGGTRG